MSGQKTGRYQVKGLAALLTMVPYSSNRVLLHPRPLQILLCARLEAAELGTLDWGLKGPIA